MTYNGIKEAPFYAIKRMPGLLCTAGGLTINEKLEVLNEAGEPLGGLYAAGNASGSYYGDDYPLFITGGSHGRAWTFGVLAAARPSACSTSRWTPGRLTVQRKGARRQPPPSRRRAPFGTLPSRGPRFRGPFCIGELGVVSSACS